MEPSSIPASSRAQGYEGLPDPIPAVIGPRQCQVDILDKPKDVTKLIMVKDFLLLIPPHGGGLLRFSASQLEFWILKHLGEDI